MGQVIRYDTVSKKRWSVDIRTHGIAVIIEKLLAEDWEDDDAGDNTQKGGVPPLVEEDDCVVSDISLNAMIFADLMLYSQDCFNWEFGEYRNSTLQLQSCGA